DQVANAAMEDAGVVEVDAAEDLAQITQSLERSRVAEYDQVEPTVVVPGDGGDGQAQGIAGQVEDEDGGAADELLGTRVEDPHRDGWELVGPARAENGLDVGHAMGGPDAARSRESRLMVSGDNLGIKAEAGHEQEAAVGGLADVDPAGPAGGDRRRESPRVAA